MQKVVTPDEVVQLLSIKNGVVMKNISTFLMSALMVTSIHIWSTKGFASQGEHEPLELVDGKLRMQFSNLQRNFSMIHSTILYHNPNLHLILEVSKGDGSLHEDGVLTLYSENLPPQLKHLTIIDTHQSVVAIGQYFLNGHRELTTLDISSLRKLTKIGLSFLTACSSLTSLGFNSFSEVTEIETCFLYECNELKKIEFMELPERQIALFGNATINGFVFSENESQIQMRTAIQQMLLSMKTGGRAVKGAAED